MAAKRKYSWEEWFGRERTTLVHGIDYHCSQSTMVATVRNNASKRKLRVRINDLGNSITMEVVGEILHTDKATVAS